MQREMLNLTEEEYQAQKERWERKRNDMFQSAKYQRYVRMMKKR